MIKLGIEPEKLNKYCLTLRVHILPTAAILEVKAGLAPIWSKHIDLTVKHHELVNKIADILRDLEVITDNGKNKFAVMVFPVPYTFTHKNIVSDNANHLLHTLMRVDMRLFKYDADKYDDVPLSCNEQSIAATSENLKELIEHLIDYISYMVACRISENDNDDVKVREMDHNGNELNLSDRITGYEYFDSIKLGGEQYYLYFANNKSNTYSNKSDYDFYISFRKNNMSKVFDIYVYQVYDSTAISITYDKYNTNDRSFTVYSFIDYCKDAKETMISIANGNLPDETNPDVRYKNYIDKHINNVRRAFDDYGRELCHVLGADYSKAIVLIESHDMCKYEPEEFDAYRDNFYPNPDNNKSPEEIKDEFNKAWLHHIHNCPHHPEHWIMPEFGIAGDNKLTCIIQDMSPEYIVEMLCDWQSFAYNDNTTGDAVDYFYNIAHAEKTALLSDSTIKLVEKGLNVIKKYRKA